MKTRVKHFHHYVIKPHNCTDVSEKVQLHRWAQGSARRNNNNRIELVQELGRRVTNIAGDSRETTCLFQQFISIVAKGTHVHSRLTCF